MYYNSINCINFYKEVFVIEQTEWLMLNFTLPKEPSRVRVSAWRKLKKSGSVNIGQSMWVLPLSDEHINIFTEISNDILQNNGEAYILRTIFISTGNAEDVAGIFNKARDEEYKEFLSKCEDFIREIEKETEKVNFNFAEIEENEDEYKKLKEWLEKINARDFFNSPLKKPSNEALEKCKRILEEFSNKVYELNTD